MYLTKEEEKMLNGEYGSAVARCMKLLVKLGEKFGAEKMITIFSAQIAGISYKNIGDAGVEFLEEFAKEGAKVRVTAFMNPAGMDLEKWKDLGINEEFAKNQMRIINALKKMGVVASATCTPYLAGLLPRFREHIAWSESSAVIFANSVIGARTNREGGPSALAAAITGRTPYYGMHLDENRKANFIVEVETSLEDITDFSALAYAVCKHVKKGIPYFKGIESANVDELKALGASLAAYGAMAMFHIEKITPEAENACENTKEKISITQEDIKNAYEEMSEKLEEVDAIAVGCPHASIDELKKLVLLLHGKKLKIPLFVFTSKAVKSVAERAGYVEKLEKANAKILTDTCPVVMPIEELGIKKLAVNSGKATFYLASSGKIVAFEKIEKLIERFCEGA